MLEQARELPETKQIGKLLRVTTQADETVQSNAKPTMAPGGLGGVTGKGFMPGQSGNPGGRPKGLAAKIRELVPPEQLTEYYLALWMRDSKKLRTLGIKVSEVTLSERTKAADWLADRGYGKAPAYALQEGDPLELDAIDQSIAAVLDDLACRREEKAARAGSSSEVAAAGEAGATPA